MCRLAAYSGPDITLAKFLLAPGHGLMEQSWAPREMREARLNADGYGFGWFAADGCAATYRIPMPIWTDANLPSLARSLTARQWLANVRSASDRMPVNPFNTMPFAEDRLLYMHNGFVQDFALALRPQLRRTLEPQFESGIHGNTDSEYMFALLRQLRAQQAPGEPLENSLVELCTSLAQWLGDTKALLNFVVGDGQSLYAVRHALNGECPSLYCCVGEADYPGGVLVASEPMTDAACWSSIAEHTVCVFTAAEAPRVLAL
jgi:glutamine amidotransferase